MPFCLHSLVYHIPLFNAISYKAKKAVFPPLCVLAVTWNALILIFIYLFYNNVKKSLSFRDSPGLSRFILAYPVEYPFVTCILPFHNLRRSGRVWQHLRSKKKSTPLL